MRTWRWTVVRWTSAASSSAITAGGRSAHVVADPFAHIRLEFEPMVYLNEAPVRLEIDAKAGTGW